MTQAITKNREAFIAFNRKNIPLVLEDKMTTDEALGRLGAFAVGMVQREIKTGEFKSLKQDTIDAKGSSKPLIDTGQMMQSTTFVLANKK